MNIYEAFRVGSKTIAKSGNNYTDLHKSHGIDQTEWELITQEEYWTPDQAREIRTVLANVIEVSMTIAGIPAIPLPGQYVAAVISEVVAPANRLVAVMKSPDTFDAADASGLMKTSEVKDMTKQQLMALTLYYSGEGKKEPPASRLPRKMSSALSEMNENESNNARVN
jgi:hypothetical protein